MKVNLQSEKWWPCLRIATAAEPDDFWEDEAVEVPDELVYRYRAAVEALHTAEAAVLGAVPKKDLPAVFA